MINSFRVRKLIASVIAIAFAAPSVAFAQSLDFYQQALLRRLDAETQGRRAAGDQSLKLLSQLPAVDIIEILPRMPSSVREGVVDIIVSREPIDDLVARISATLENRDLPLVDFFSLAYLALDHSEAIPFLCRFAAHPNPKIAGPAIMALAKPSPNRAVVYLDAAFDRFPDAPSRELMQALDLAMGDRDRAFGGLWLKLFKAHSGSNDWLRALTTIASRHRFHAAMQPLYDAYAKRDPYASIDFPAHWTLSVALADAISFRIDDHSTAAEERETIKAFVEQDAVIEEFAESRGTYDQAFAAAPSIVRALDSKTFDAPAAASFAFRVGLAIERGVAPAELVSMIKSDETQQPPAERRMLLNVVARAKTTDTDTLMKRVINEKDPDIQTALCESLDASLAAMTIVRRKQAAEALFPDFIEFMKLEKPNGADIIVSLWTRYATVNEAAEIPALLAATHPDMSSAVKLDAFRRALTILKTKDCASPAPYVSVIGTMLIDGKPEIAGSLTQMLSAYFQPPIEDAPYAREIIDALVESLKHAGDDAKKILPERLTLFESLVGGHWFGRFDPLAKDPLPAEYGIQLLEIGAWWRMHRDIPFATMPEKHPDRAGADPSADAKARFATLAALSAIDPEPAIKELSRLPVERFVAFAAAAEGHDLDRALRVGFALHRHNALFTGGLLAYLETGKFADPLTLLDYLERQRDPALIPFMQSLALLPNQLFNYTDYLNRFVADMAPAAAARYALTNCLRGEIIDDARTQMLPLIPHLDACDPLIFDAVARVLDRDWTGASADEYLRGILFCEIARRGKIDATAPALIRIAQMPVKPIEDDVDHRQRLFMSAVYQTLTDLVPDRRLAKAFDVSTGQIDSKAIADWWADRQSSAAIPVIDAFTDADINNADIRAAAVLLDTLAGAGDSSLADARRYGQWLRSEDSRLRWRGLRGLVETGGGEREFGGDPMRSVLMRLDDPDPWMQMAAIYGCRRFNDVEPMSELVAFACRTPDLSMNRRAALALASWGYDRSRMRHSIASGAPTDDSAGASAKFGSFWRRVRDQAYLAMQSARSDEAKLDWLTLWLTAPVFDNPTELERLRGILASQDMRFRGRTLVLLTETLHNQENNVTSEFLDVLLPLFSAKPTSTDEIKVAQLATICLIRIAEGRTLRDALTVRINDAIIESFTPPITEDKVILLRTFEIIVEKRFLPTAEDKAQAFDVLDAFQRARDWWTREKETSDKVKRWQATPIN